MKENSAAPEKPKRPHTLNIENCAKGFLTGVEKVTSSNDAALVLQTSAGGLQISGTDLKINKFDTDSGALVFEGAVSSIRYSAAKVPLLKRLFK
ncbi:MAG: sporulation protein YabP [Firmicutes bacterium]|nr:sporulation protein YabP [Bacillota bacterium]